MIKLNSQKYLVMRRMNMEDEFRKAIADWVDYQKEKEIELEKNEY